MATIFRPLQDIVCKLLASIFTTLARQNIIFQAFASAGAMVKVLAK